MLVKVPESRAASRRPYTRRHFMRRALIGAGGMACAPGVLANSALQQFIEGMPKAELHVHLEGTVEPAVAMKIAARNGLSTPYKSVEEFEAALNFDSLASFLKAFHDTIAVLKTERDFYEITYSYLKKCHSQNIVYADLKFDPQAHQRRGIEFDVFLRGIHQAQLDAEQSFGVSSQLIMCFQRDAPLETAEAAFSKALGFQDQIVGIGLDNTEVLNFPAKFSDIFTRARKEGFKLTSHCDLGQPNTLEHIRACIEDLQVDRLDHGYNILADERLVQLALDKSLCFTACPTSAFNTTDHSQRFYFREVSLSIKKMLDIGLRVTVNTDDPGVMGNRYLNEVFVDMANHLALDRQQVATLSRNAFDSLWMPQEQKQQYLSSLSRYMSTHGSL